MVSPFTLPPLGMGPGSQPDPDGELQYLPMPSGMRTYAPHLPETNDPEGLALLERLALACDRAAAGEEGESFDLGRLPPGARHTVAEALGEGAVTILSRGFGNCRVKATAQARVWHVQFFNSMDVLILDTYEVTDLPEVALAAREDLADSANRIRDVIETIR